MKWKERVSDRIRPVYVEWVDSSSIYGWRPPETCSAPATIKSVGYLLRQDHKGIVLTNGISELSGNVSDQMSIPKGAVLKLKFLKV